MAYTPPTGDDVTLIFGGDYTPPAGDSVSIGFGTPEYSAPDPYIQEDTKVGIRPLIMDPTTGRKRELNDNETLSWGIDEPDITFLNILKADGTTELFIPLAS